MKKRGQVTIFIILGILIVLIIAGFFIFNNYNKANLNSDLNRVNSFIESCIKQTGRNALVYVGSRGGHFSIPDLSTSEGIPYYLYEGVDHSPNREYVENQISLYIDNFIYFCLDDFNSFENLNINVGYPNTKTTIEKERIILNTKFNVEINRGENNYQIEDFNDIDISVGLGKIINAAQEIIETQKEVENLVCLTCLYDISEKHQLYIHMSDSIDDNAVVFIIRDDLNQIDNRDYIFYFASKFKANGGISE
jgi:cell division protein FtsL